MSANTLGERFPRAKSAWFETSRAEAGLVTRPGSAVYVPRLKRRHPVKSRLTGIIY